MLVHVLGLVCNIKRVVELCKEYNVILIEELQMPGKKRVLVSEYIKGNSIESDKILG